MAIGRLGREEGDYLGNRSAIAAGVQYTGADLLDAVSVEVLDKAGKALVEGTDYVVFVANDLKPLVAVDEVVNAGKKATPSTMPKAIEAAGTYEFKIVPAEGNVNFVFENTVYKMFVTDQNVFPDVPAAKWFADEVYKISTYKVLPKGETDPDKAVAPMGGYANGLFGPYDSMKRSDMALVLARAAGIAKPGTTARSAAPR